MAFLANQLVNLAIVIALVRATENQYGRGGHALQRVPAGIDVGGLGVINVAHSFDRRHVLQTMVHTSKLLQALANHIVVNMQDLCCQTCCHGVILVVLASETQLLQRYAEGRDIGFGMNDQVTAIGVGNVLLIAAEGVECRLWLYACNLAVNDGVLAPVDEGILARLVACDTELSIHIVLELVVVSVQVVGRDIEQNGNIRLEIVAVIQLERGELNHVVVMILLCHLQRQRIADIACQTDIQSSAAKHIKEQRCGGRLAIRTSDTNHFAACVACRKLNLREDRCTLCYELLHEGGSERNTRRLNDFICRQYALCGVLACFPCYMVLVEQGLISRRDLAPVAHKDLHTFGFRQYGSTCARFACA